MKRFPLIVAFSLLTSVFLFAQEKVSDLKNEPLFIPNQFYWATSGLDTFFLFSNVYKTSVFKAKNRKLTAHQEWEHRALDQRSIPILQNNHEKKLLVYKDKYVLEGYRNELIFTDISSGEIWRKISFSTDSFNISYTYDAIIFDDKIYLRAYYQGKQILMVVEPESSSWQLTDFEISGQITRFGNFLISNSGGSVNSFDVTKNEKKELYASASKLSSLFIAENRLFLLFKNGEMISFDSDLNQQSFHCDFPPNTQVILTADTLFMVYVMESSSLFYKLYDIRSCDTPLAVFDERYFGLIDFNAASGDILYDFYGSNLQVFYKYNIYTKQITPIDSIHSDIGFGNKVRNNTKKLQYYVNNPPMNNPVFITQMDFENNQFHGIDIPLIDINQQFYFYQTETTSQQILQHDPNGKLRWWLVDDATQKVTLLDSVVYFQNTSGELVANYSMVANDRVFFNTNQGIFVTEGNQTSLLHRAKPYAQPISYDGKLYQIVDNFPQGKGLLITDEITLVNQYIKFDNNHQSIFQVTPAGKGFFIKYSEFGPYEQWFDVKSQTFFDFNYNGIRLVPSITAQNGDVVLIKALQSFYVLNTQTNVISKVNITGNLFIIGNGQENTLYGNHQNQNLTEIIKIDQQGDIQILRTYDIPSFTVSAMVNIKGNDASVLAIKYLDKMDILLDKSGAVSVQTIDQIQGSLFSVKFAGEKIWIELRSTSGENQFITWKENEEHQVYLSEKNIIMTDVFNSGDNNLLFFYNPIEKQFYVHQIAVHNNELISEFIVPISSNFNFSGQNKSILQLSENYILCKFHDGQKGEEPWIYDVAGKSFFLLKDMFEGQHGSNPKNFVLTSDYAYFTAMDKDLDRQWYRLNISDIVSTTEPSAPDHTILFPNPAEEMIFSKQPLFEVHMFDMTGKQVGFSTRMSASEGINIVSLSSGVYILSGLDVNNQPVVEKFVKP
jgi:hypothetical protein